MMNHTKTLRKLERTIQIWRNDLDHYDMEALHRKPSPDSWSMGQVYIHLIQATLGYHLKQVESCLENTANAAKKKNLKGFVTYHILGSIPPIKVKVPPSDAYTPKQPESKEQILQGLDKVMDKMKHWQDKLSKKPQGKTVHPGFAWLNANEWYKLVEMHFRHHLRQKKRIEEYLNGQI